MNDHTNDETGTEHVAAISSLFVGEAIRNQREDSEGITIHFIVSGMGVSYQKK